MPETQNYVGIGLFPEEAYLVAYGARLRMLRPLAPFVPHTLQDADGLMWISRIDWPHKKVYVDKRGNGTNGTGIETFEFDGYGFLET